ncbi:hypothetical protein [Cupriavidus sp. P-10]
MVPKGRIPPSGKKVDTTNARSETVATKYSFAKAWKHCYVCLVSASCF